MFRKLKNRFKSNKKNKKPGPPLLSIHEIKPSITSIVTIYKSRKPPNDVFSAELPHTNTSETFVFERRTSNREVNNIAAEAQDLLNRNIVTELEKLNRWLCEAITNIQDGAINARRPSSVKIRTSETRPRENVPSSGKVHTESTSFVEDRIKQIKGVKSNPSEYEVEHLSKKGKFTGRRLWKDCVTVLRSTLSNYDFFCILKTSGASGLNGCHTHDSHSHCCVNSGFPKN